MDRNAFNIGLTTAVAVGQAEFTTPGTYQLVVPPNCYSMSAVAIGAGQSGGRGTVIEGGNGGDLRYIKEFAVTPGEILTVVVGAGGVPVSGQNAKQAGGSTSFRRGAESALLNARGGGAGGTSTALSANVGGGAGGAGGTDSSGRGGGGAGGYAGNGGAGNGAAGATNSGAAGGGTNTGSQSTAAGAGGGVGIYGAGTTGAGGTGTGGGAGGSGGTAGTAGAGNVAGQGGAYGGGGGFNGASTLGGAGGNGAARFIWPAPTRQYPSTLTQNM